MKKTLQFILVVLFFLSVIGCNNYNDYYSQINNGFKFKFNAVSDSDAYLKAFIQFKRSQLSYYLEKSKKEKLPYAEPKQLRLYDSNLFDITDKVIFLHKDSILSSITDSLTREYNSYQ